MTKPIKADDSEHKHRSSGSAVIYLVRLFHPVKTTYKTQYLTTKACGKCEYADTPTPFGAHPIIDVRKRLRHYCPKCGSADFHEMVGRWEIEKTSRLYWFPTTRLLKFHSERKYEPIPSPKYKFDRPKAKRTLVGESDTKDLCAFLKYKGEDKTRA